MSRSDREFERLVRDSRLAGYVYSLAQAAHTAWQHSRTRRPVRFFVDAWGGVDEVESIRLVAAVVIAAGVTTLAVQTLASNVMAPVPWMLPAACTVAGAVTWTIAGAIARARRYPRG